MGSRNGLRSPEAANRTPWDTRELPPAPATHRRRPRWNRLVWHQAAAPRRPSKLKEPSVPLQAEICSSCCPPWEAKGQYSEGFAGKPPFLGAVLHEVPKRSDDGRVGKAAMRTGTIRWARYIQTKKQTGNTLAR